MKSNLSHGLSVPSDKLHCAPKMWVVCSQVWYTHRFPLCTSTLETVFISTTVEAPNVVMLCYWYVIRQIRFIYVLWFTATTFTSSCHIYSFSCMYPVEIYIWNKLRFQKWPNPGLKSKGIWVENLRTLNNLCSTFNCFCNNSQYTECSPKMVLWLESAVYGGDTINDFF